MAKMMEYACDLDKNCTVEMDPETFNSDFLSRRYTESLVGALVAIVLLIGLFACKIHKITVIIKFSISRFFEKT